MARDRKLHLATITFFRPTDNPGGETVSLWDLAGSPAVSAVHLIETLNRIGVQCLATGRPEQVSPGMYSYRLVDLAGETVAYMCIAEFLG